MKKPTDKQLESAKNVLNYILKSAQQNRRYMVHTIDALETALGVLPRDMTDVQEMNHE